MGRKVPFRRSVGPCSRHLRDFSDSFSRKLAEQARLPTLRYHIGIRVYAGDPYAAHGSIARTAMRQRAGTRERKVMMEQGGERPPEQPRRERRTRSSMQEEGRSNASGYSPTMRRPDLVTFAAIIMFTLGCFHVLLAISEFANSTWVLSRIDIQLFIPIL